MAPTVIMFIIALVPISFHSLKSSIATFIFIVQIFCFFFYILRLYEAQVVIFGFKIGFATSSIPKSKWEPSTIDNGRRVVGTLKQCFYF